MAYFDAVLFRAASSGTGDFVVSSAITGYRTPRAASVPNGATGSYRAFSDDLTEWEQGTYVYTSGTTTAVRTVTANSLGTTAKINFTVAPQVGFVESAADLANASLLRTGLVDYKLTRAARGHIWGLTLANNAGTPNTVFGIAAGESASNDATTPALMVAAAFSKTTGAWAVGSGNGSLDTGSVAANTWYHVFQIMRPDTGVVDYLLSTSATAPTMPTSYTHKRRIGSIKTNASSQIIAFKQFEDVFFLGTAVTDLNGTTTNNADITVTLSVPTGVRVEPIIKFTAQNSANNSAVYLRSPDLESGETSTDLGSLKANIGHITNGASPNRIASSFVRLLTNTSGQIIVRFDPLSGTTTGYIRTYGFVDTRGRLS